MINDFVAWITSLEITKWQMFLNEICVSVCVCMCTKFSFLKYKEAHKKHKRHNNWKKNVRQPKDNNRPIKITTAYKNRRETANWQESKTVWLTNTLKQTNNMIRITMSVLQYHQRMEQTTIWKYIAHWIFMEI